MSKTTRGYISLITVAVVLTLGLGVWMRWQLAGSVSGLGTFAYLRHAHSHLGYYGVLFPLLWLAWHRAGASLLSLRSLAAYAVVVVIATIGFLYAGYGVVAIAGSTVVGLFWLATAWGHRKELRERTWLANVPPMILTTSLLIPPIAVMTARGDPLMHELVRSFLYVQLFGMFIPAALERAELPAPPRQLWWLATLAAAAHVGPVPHPALGLAHLVLAGWLVRISLQGGGGVEGVEGVEGVVRVPVLIRGLWFALALSLAMIASGFLVADHTTAVAGVHFAIIGPVLLTFAWREIEDIPLILATVTVLALLTMTAAIGIPVLMTPPPWTATVTAIAGTILAGCLMLGLARLHASRRST